MAAETGAGSCDLVRTATATCCENFPVAGSSDDQFVREAGGDEHFSVGTQRQRVRPHAGQFDLRAGGRDELVDRRDEGIAVAADRSRSWRRNHPRKLPVRENPASARSSRRGQNLIFISSNDETRRAPRQVDVTVKFIPPPDRAACPARDICGRNRRRHFPAT